MAKKKKKRPSANEPKYKIVPSPIKLGSEFGAAKVYPSDPDVAELERTVIVAIHPTDRFCAVYAEQIKTGKDKGKWFAHREPLSAVAEVEITVVNSSIHYGAEIDRHVVRELVGMLLHLIDGWNLCSGHHNYCGICDRDEAEWRYTRHGMNARARDEYLETERVAEPVSKHTGNGKAGSH
jgi:hypothetical protein